MTHQSLLFDMQVIVRTEGGGADHVEDTDSVPVAITAKLDSLEGKMVPEVELKQYFHFTGGAAGHRNWRKYRDLLTGAGCIEVVTGTLRVRCYVASAVRSAAGASQALHVARYVRLAQLTMGYPWRGAESFSCRHVTVCPLTMCAGACFGMCA
jgi:hypothetical protein